MKSLKTRLKITTLITGIFYCFGHAQSHATECPHFLKVLFTKQNPTVIRAPRKEGMKIVPEELLAEDGYFVNFERDPVTNGVTRNTIPAFRILPDSETSLGRFSERLKKMDTGLFIQKQAFDKADTGAYFSRVKEFRPSNPSLNQIDSFFLGKAIVLPIGKFDPQDLQITLMHEGFHAYGERLREKGITYGFNSSFRSGYGSDGLISPARGYEDYMHSEEVHAYTKDFINVTVIAKNRETMKLIEDQLKLMRRSLSREEKLKKVRIAYETVVSPQKMKNQSLQLSDVIRAHEENLKAVEFELLKYIRNQGKGADLVFKSTKKGGMVLQTKNVSLYLNDVKGVETPANVKIAVKKIRDMKLIDRQLKQELERVLELNSKAEQAGFFTAIEYLDLKSRMGKLSKLVTVKGGKP